MTRMMSQFSHGMRIMQPAMAWPKSATLSSIRRVRVTKVTEQVGCHRLRRYRWVITTDMAKAMKKNLKGLSEKEREAVEVLTKGMLNKLLHAPMAYLRSDASENGKASLPQIQDLFQLGEKSGRGRGRR